MKIRHKLSVSFALTGTIILLLFGLSIYFFAANYNKQDFYEQLGKRVIITENMFLEKEHFSESNFARIKEQFLHTLPQEQEEVIEIVNNRPLQSKYPYPKSFIDKILTDSMTFYKAGERQIAGKYFHLEGGNYLVIVSAVDEAGIKILTHLRGIIISGLLVWIISFTLISISISRRIIKPLTIEIELANKISAHNLDQRLSGIKSNDEIGDLAIAFNSLLERLENAFKAKKLFISNASHELRNPLAAIINEVDIALQQERTMEEYRKALKSISADAEHIKMVFDNLLELSRISYAESPVQYEYLSLIPLIEEVLEGHSYTNRKNKLKFDTDEKTRNAMPGIWGNRILMTTALLNVLDNACKFSDEKDVVLSLHLDLDEAVISVSDKGIGVPEVELKLISEPFYRATNVGSIRGSGVGITLVKKIVEIHQGMLSITSELGKGTLVIIRLPLEKNLRN